MGGFGSGNSEWRSSKKTTVEDCRRLDAARWMREGILKADVWHRGSWAWYTDASMTEKTSALGYEVNTTAAEHYVRLTYTITRTGQDVAYRISLTTTRPRFGGLRWWFLCPLSKNSQPCGRRVGKLYLPPGGHYYGCRHCHELTYTSCRESHKYDALDRITALLYGTDFETVKQDTQ